VEIATHCCSLSLSPENPDWIGFIFVVPAHPSSLEQNPESWIDLDEYYYYARLTAFFPE